MRTGCLHQQMQATFDLYKYHDFGGPALAASSSLPTRSIARVRSRASMGGSPVPSGLVAALAAFSSILFKASRYAELRAWSAGIPMSGVTPVPSQLVLVIGLMARPDGTKTSK